MISFYICGGVAVLSTLLVILTKRPIHALLYFILSLLALAICMHLLEAPFSAALEVIVYAGAIMVLFVFVVMLLNVSHDVAMQKEHRIFQWIPFCLAAILFGQMLVIFMGVKDMPLASSVSVHDLSTHLFSVYGLAVEVASLILLAGLLGAYHLGRR